MAATLISRSVLSFSLKSADSQTLILSTSTKSVPNTKDFRYSKTLILSSAVKSATHTTYFRGFPKSEQNASGIMGLSSACSRGRILCTANLVELEPTVFEMKKLFSDGLFAFSKAELAGKVGQYIVTGLVIAFAVKVVFVNVLIRMTLPFCVGETIKVQIKEGEEVLEGEVVEIGYLITQVQTAEKLVSVPNYVLSEKVIQNKSRSFTAVPNSMLAREGILIKPFLMVRKVILPIDNMDKISLITEDIKSMLRSKSYVFSGSLAPSCYVSKIENSFAEVIFKCYVRTEYVALTNSDEILFDVFRIVEEEHGVDIEEYLTLDSETESISGDS